MFGGSTGACSTSPRACAAGCSMASRPYMTTSRWAARGGLQDAARSGARSGGPSCTQSGLCGEYLAAGGACRTFAHRGVATAASQLDGALSSMPSAQLQGSIQSAEGLLKEVPNIELAVVLEQLGRAVGAVVGAIASPFAIFGPDKPLVNVLFVTTSLVLAFGLVAKAPRQ
eukprot:218839-Chlamydomonas_euryale.AAC.15